MKRFHFQLEPVLGYKLQVLDTQMIELGSIQAEVRRQEECRDAAQQLHGRSLLDKYGRHYSFYFAIFAAK